MHRAESPVSMSDWDDFCEDIFIKPQQQKKNALFSPILLLFGLFLHQKINKPKRSHQKTSKLKMRVFFKKLNKNSKKNYSHRHR